MIKRCSLLLALCIMLCLLFGCGLLAPAASPAPTQPVVERTAEPEPGLQIAVLDTGHGAEMWRDVIAAFTAQTGVETELIIDENLERIIEPAIRAGQAPNVIHLPTGREAGLTERLIREKYLVDMSGVLSMTIPGEQVSPKEKLIDGFADSSLTNPYQDGRMYLAPMFYTPYGLFYNAGLFAQKGWQVPTTWNEMWALGDAAKFRGISLFTYPNTQAMEQFCYALMYAVGGPTFFDAVTQCAEGVWDTPEGEAYLDILSRLAGYTAPVTPAQTNEQDDMANRQLVMQDQALFMPEGIGVVGEMAEMPRAEGFQWGMTALPALQIGGDGYSYADIAQTWIPKQAGYIEEAKQFVAFLYSDAAIEIFAAAGAIQPIQNMADRLTGDDVMFYSVYDTGAKAAMGSFAPHDPASGLRPLREVCFDQFNALVSGEITPEQYRADVKRASDAMRANQNA